MAKPSVSIVLQPDGSMKCLRCGGTQFVTRHSTGRKLSFGVGVLLASANQVQCVACGAKYSRKLDSPSASSPLPPGGGSAFRRAKHAKKRSGGSP